MSSLPEKLMLVDENAFVFHPVTEEDKIRNADMLTFLRDAQGIFKTILVTDRPLAEIRADLNATDLSEILRERIPQDFLDISITPWNEYEGKDADVVISTDEFVRTRLGDYERILSPGYTQAPEAFYYFWESCKDDIDVTRITAELGAIVKMNEIQIKSALDKTYPDPELVWKKISTSPAFTILAEAFATAKQNSWDEHHPQDETIEYARRYFEYTSIGHRIKKPGRELLSCRSYLQFMFRKHNVGGQYDRTKDLSKSDFSATREHRSILNQALMTIHQIVKDEPTRRLV